MRLSELKLGEKAQITHLEMNREFALRLLAFGMIPGSTIELCGKGPLNDPHIYLVRGCRMALRRKDAENVFVQRKRDK